MTATTLKNVTTKVDQNKIRARLEALENQGRKKNSNDSGPSLDRWQPKKVEGGKSEYVIRFVPTADGDPFKDLHFHYGVSRGGILCPKNNFDEKCPICDYASGLWRKAKDTGDAEMEKQAKELFVKQRFAAPVIVRGDDGSYEDESGEKVEFGVRWYTFGKKTYEQVLKLILNPDYGDITDVHEGVDFVLEYDASTGRNFPETTLTPKRKSSPLFENDKKIANVLGNIPDLTEIFRRMSPEEVDNELRRFLEVTDDDGEGTEHVAGNGMSDVDEAIAALRAN